MACSFTDFGRARLVFQRANEALILPRSGRGIRCVPPRSKCRPGRRMTSRAEINSGERPSSRRFAPAGDYFIPSVGGFGQWRDALLSPSGPYLLLLGADDTNVRKEHRMRQIVISLLAAAAVVGCTPTEQVLELALRRALLLEVSRPAMYEGPQSVLPSVARPVPLSAMSPVSLVADAATPMAADMSLPARVDPSRMV